MAYVRLGETTATTAPPAPAPPTQHHYLARALFIAPIAALVFVYYFRGVTWADDRTPAQRAKLPKARVRR